MVCILFICSGSWKEKAFKEYNFDAQGIQPISGHLHPLMKVRAQFRQIFLEMGYVRWLINFTQMLSCLVILKVLAVAQYHITSWSKILCTYYCTYLIICGVDLLLHYKINCIKCLMLFYDVLAALLRCPQIISSRVPFGILTRSSSPSNTLPEMHMTLSSYQVLCIHPCLT